MKKEDIKMANNEIKNLIKLFVFQEEIYQKCNSTKFKTPKNINIKENKIIFIKKNIMKKYKELFGYKNLFDLFKREKKIFKYIKEDGFFNYKKLNDSLISEIIKKLEKDFIIKIPTLNNDELLKELKNEDKKEWNFKCISYINQENEKDKEINLKLINDFKIINIEILQFFTDKNIIFNSLLNGNYIIEDKKIFTLFKDFDGVLYEIGNLDENGNFNIEYIFNPEQIKYSNSFLDGLVKLGIKDLLKKIDKKEEITKILIDNKPYKLYKVNQNKIKELKNQKYQNTNYFKNENKNAQINNININNSFTLSSELKSLILISLYQNKIIENQNFKDKKNNVYIDEVYPLNKKFFEKYYFNDINILLNKNDEIHNIIKDINFKDLSINFDNVINKIIDKLNKNELNQINKKISEIKTNISYNVKGEEIKLSYSNKIKIYEEFILINKNIFNYYRKNSQFIFENPYMYFVSFNKKQILINNKELTMLIGNLIIEKNLFLIEYILHFQNLEIFDKELGNLINLDYENYFKEKLFFNNNPKVNDYIVPLISNGEIVGNAYKYNSEIKDYCFFLIILNI